MLDLVINEFLKVFFENASNVIQFGSSLQEKKSKDIDLLVFQEDRTLFTKECFSYKGNKFDVITLPKARAYEIIEINKIYGIYTSVLLQGKIILDPDGFVLSLKKDIISQKNKTPPFLKYRELGFKIGSLYELLAESKDDDEKDYLFGHLLNYYLIIKLLDYHQKIFQSEKHRLRAIKKYEPLFFKEIWNLKKEYTSGNVILTEVKQFFKNKFPLLNPDKQAPYSNHHIFSNIIGEVVIQIRSESSKSIYLSEVYSFVKTKISKEFFLFHIEKNSLNFIENGYYLILEEPCVENKRNLLLSLAEMKGEFKKQYSFLYPYQMSISSLIGISDKQFNMSFQSYFIKISSYMNEQAYKNNVLLFLNSLFTNLLKYGYTKHQFILLLKQMGFILGNHFVKHDQPLDIKKEVLQKVVVEKEKEMNYLKLLKTLYFPFIKNWNVIYLPSSKINHFSFDIRLIPDSNKAYFVYFISKTFMIDTNNLILLLSKVGQLLENED